MTNRITASIPFSFKGELHTPSYQINLDNLMEKGHSFPQNLDRLIARENQIDAYSYEFEVLEGSEIVFTAEGELAQAYLDENGRFDFEGFAEAWLIEHNLPRLRHIAKHEMQVDELDAQPQLKAALTAAFRCGLEQALPEPQEAEEIF